MVGKFVAIALFVGAVFATYGTKRVFDASAFKAHKTTDAMLSAIDEAEVTYV